MNCYTQLGVCDLLTLFPFAAGVITVAIVKRPGALAWWWPCNPKGKEIRKGPSDVFFSCLKGLGEGSTQVEALENPLKLVPVGLLWGSPHLETLHMGTISLF